MGGSCIHCGAQMKFNRGWIGWICEDCYEKNKTAILQRYREIKKARKAKREDAEKNPIRKCRKCGRGIPLNAKDNTCQKCKNSRNVQLEIQREAEVPDPELDAVAKEFNRRVPDQWLAEYMFGTLKKWRTKDECK